MEKGATSASLAEGCEVRQFWLRRKAQHQLLVFPVLSVLYLPHVRPVQPEPSTE